MTIDVVPRMMVVVVMMMMVGPQWQWQWQSHQGVDIWAPPGSWRTAPEIFWFWSWCRWCRQWTGRGSTNYGGDKSQQEQFAGVTRNNVLPGKPLSKNWDEIFKWNGWFQRWFRQHLRSTEWDPSVVIQAHSHDKDLSQSTHMRSRNARKNHPWQILRFDIETHICYWIAFIGNFVW